MRRPQRPNISDWVDCILRVGPSDGPAPVNSCSLFSLLMSQGCKRMSLVCLPLMLLILHMLLLLRSSQSFDVWRLSLCAASFGSCLVPAVGVGVCGRLQCRHAFQLGHLTLLLLPGSVKPWASPFLLLLCRVSFCCVCEGMCAREHTPCHR